VIVVAFDNPTQLTNTVADAKEEGNRNGSPCINSDSAIVRKDNTDNLAKRRNSEDALQAESDRVLTTSINAAPTPDKPRPTSTIGIFWAAVDSTEPTKKTTKPICLDDRQ